MCIQMNSFVLPFGLNSAGKHVSDFYTNVKDAGCCSVLQGVEGRVHCSVLHCIKWCRRALWLTNSYTSVLQDAVCCSVLQCVAVFCSALQCIALH